MSASTLRALPGRTSLETDGVVQMVRWLGDAEAARLPFALGPLPIADDGILRLAARALYDALDAERATREMTWTQVGAASGVAAGRIAQLARGRRVELGVALRLAAWLDERLARFVRISAR